MAKEPVIRCPLCEWVPKADSRWVCAPSEPGAGCFTSWNTFWTVGCCPGCGHFWNRTQCLACKQASPHQDWYFFPPDEELAKDRERELEATH